MDVEDASLSDDIEVIRDSVLQNIEQYCATRSEKIEGILKLENETEKRKLTLVRETMNELNDIYSIHEDVQARISKLYFRATSLIVEHLHNIKNQFNNIVINIDNNNHNEKDYALLNEYAPILVDTDWVYELSQQSDDGKANENELLASISTQLQQRAFTLESDSKKIQPTINDLEALQSIEGILQKVSKMRLLEQFLPAVAKMSLRVIDIVQNDVRAILDEIIDEYSMSADDEKEMEHAGIIISVNCGKIIQTLAFLKKCAYVSWMKQPDLKNLKPIIMRCTELIKCYLKQTGNDRDAKLRNSLMLLTTPDTTSTDAVLKSHVNLVYKILCEYQRIRAKPTEYAVVIHHMYEENNITAGWDNFLHVRVKKFTQKLGSLCVEDKLLFSVAVDRAEILTEIDRLLETEFNYKSAFGQLYLTYKAQLYKHTGDSKRIEDAIKNHEFDEVHNFMESLQQMENKHLQQTFQHIQTKLKKMAERMCADFRFHIMQLSQHRSTIQMDDVNMIVKQFKWIKDIDEYCRKYIIDFDTATKPKQVGIKMLNQYLTAIAIFCKNQTELNQFEDAEKHIQKYNIIVMYLGELFEDKISNLRQQVQVMEKELKHRLESVCKKYTEDITFDDNIIEARQNMYEQLPAVYRQLLQAKTQNTDYFITWKKIDADIKAKFDTLLNKAKQAETYSESRNILQFCRDILGSFPDETKKLLQKRFDLAWDILQKSNLQHIEQLQQHLCQNDAPAVFKLYTEMSNEGNTRMVNKIQSELTKWANNMKSTIQHCTQTEDANAIGNDFALLSEFHSLFSSNVAIQYRNARNCIESFIKKKIENTQCLLEAIKQGCVRQISRNLQVLVRLFVSPDDHLLPNSGKHMKQIICQYQVRLSKFIHEFFEQQTSNFAAALKDLDNIRIDKALNIMQWCEPEIKSDLQLLSNSDLGKHMSYGQMVQTTRKKIRDALETITKAGVVNKKFERNMQDEHLKYFSTVKYQLCAVQESCHQLRSHIPAEETRQYLMKCIVSFQDQTQTIVKDVTRKLNSKVVIHMRKFICAKMGLSLICSNFCIYFHSFAQIFVYEIMQIQDVI